MATECHFCSRRIEDADVRWFLAFGGPSVKNEDGSIDTSGAVTKEPGPGRLAICAACLARQKESNARSSEV